eukprot:958705-Prymnesium_polylepis.1
MDITQYLTFAAPSDESGGTNEQKPEDLAYSFDFSVFTTPNSKCAPFCPANRVEGCETIDMKQCPANYVQPIGGGSKRDNSTLYRYQCDLCGLTWQQMRETATVKRVTHQSD